MSAQSARLSGQHAPGDVASPAWIQSPAYDLCCFILSPLLGLLWLLTAPGEAGILAMLALLGVPHSLSTFALYFWEDNQRYCWSRWVAFAVGPVCIAGAVVALVHYQIPYVLQVAVYVWNTYHVARQSCGMLSLYRHRAGVRDPHHKGLANTAILASNGSLAVWHLDWHPGLYRPLSFLSPALPSLLWLGLSLVAVLALLRLGVSLWQRWGTEATPRMPELGFLLTSLLLFHPYVWIRDGTQATTGMLIGHFVQYLGIVWLLHRRRFSDRSASPGPRWLASLSTHTPLLLGAVLAIGGVYLLGKHLCSLWSLSLTFDTALFILALLHFYLDRLFWAFKELHVRKTIGRYLIAGPSPVAVMPVESVLRPPGLQPGRSV